MTDVLMQSYVRRKMDILDMKYKGYSFEASFAKARCSRDCHAGDSSSASLALNLNLSSG